jgi:hypothetical protein
MLIVNTIANVESGVKHHKPTKPIIVCNMIKNNSVTIPTIGIMMIEILVVIFNN